MGWSTDVGGRKPLSWAFGISPNYVSVGAGVMGFDKSVLKLFAFNLIHKIECETPTTLRGRGPFVTLPDSSKMRKALDDWRRSAAGPDGAALAQQISAACSGGYRLDDPVLKRDPAPFDRDHPQQGFLRRKGLMLWQDWPSHPEFDPKGGLIQVFGEVLPIQTRLRGIV